MKNSVNGVCLKKHAEREAYLNMLAITANAVNEWIEETEWCLNDKNDVDLRKDELKALKRIETLLFKEYENESNRSDSSFEEYFEEVRRRTDAEYKFTEDL